MTPTTNERLASVIRSLTEVVMPHLPADASLAQEQVQLAIGHLQILRLQFDSVHEFEAEELADTKALAAELAAAMTGGALTTTAGGSLSALIAEPAGEVRAALSAVYRGVERLVQAVSADGSEEARKKLPEIILRHESKRVEKDRRWFLPYGFDTMDAAA